MLQVMNQQASFLLHFLELSTVHRLILEILAVPSKRSSHYIKGVLIGVMATMAITLAVLLAFLWICLLSKKERAAKKYTEVKKQVVQDASKPTITLQFFSIFTFSSLSVILSLIFKRYKAYHLPW